MMTETGKAERIVKDMELMSPYFYEGLYGAFLRNYMFSDRLRWSADLSDHLGKSNEEWADVGKEIALILWDRFERRISC